MWNWLFGSWPTIGYVACTTVLIYLSTVIGVRLGERRTLADMSAFDFVVAVAMGGIIARTATTRSPTYVQGVTAVLALVVAHRVLSWGRMRSTSVRRVAERRPLLLLWGGRVLPDALRRAHVTEEDLYTVLREHGVRRVADVAAVILESRGAFSVIVRGTEGVDRALLRAVAPPG